MLAAALLLPSLTALAAPKVGEKAPEFTLKDETGKEHSLGSLKGKYVVLEWTSTKCPYVVGHYERETMKKTLAKLKAKQGDVVWLGIDSSHYTNGKETTDFKKKFAFDWPVLQDADGKTGKAYDARTTPHMFIVDPEGVLRYDGAIDDDKTDSKGEKAVNYVSLGFDKLLAKQTVDPSKTEPYGCTVKYK